MNILILQYHTAPYRDPFLKQLMGGDSVNIFTVCNLFTEDAGHKYWDHVSESNSSCGKSFSFFGRLLHPNIFRIFVHHKYDVVIVCGYYHLTTLYLILLSKLFSKKLIIMVDNIYDASSLSDKIKVNLLKVLSSAVWVPGKACENSIFKCKPNWNKPFFHGAYALEYSYIQNILKNSSLNILHNKSLSKDNLHFVMAANFTHNRMHKSLIEVFSNLLKSRSDIHLSLLGEGKYKTECQQYVRDNSLSESVSFIGGVTYTEMISFFASSDCYIHTGEEPYSTAIVAAAMTGLPVLSSKSVGGVFDVLEDGNNGFLFDTTSQASILFTLNKFLSLSEDEKKEFGKKSKILSQSISSEVLAEQFIKDLNKLI